ncbi:MAG: metal ABC transporter permease [Gammaproteobacteria bacterium]|nr:metal ABC transporter permease [Gammaproteobacteria bacterium]
MFEFFTTLSSQAFLQNALLGGILASIGCGLTGSFVVVNRIGYMAGGIAHSVLGGMGVAYYLGLNPFAGALIAALLAALIIGVIKLKWQHQEDTTIGAIWAVGMAVGIIFISKSDGYNTNLMSFLFGNILIISDEQLFIMLFLDLITIVFVVAFYKQLVAISFDIEFATVRGISVNLFYLLLLCLIAITVVLLIQVVGLILVIALLTLPAAIAKQYVHSIGLMMLLASVLGVVFTSTGLFLSYEPDLPAGATIILVAGVAYFLSSLLKSFVHFNSK